MIQDELDLAWEKAWSRQPQNPNDLSYIGMVVKGSREYLFYKDKQGNYWYDSRPIECKRNRG